MPLRKYLQKLKDFGWYVMLFGNLSKQNIWHCMHKQKMELNFHSVEMSRDFRFHANKTLKNKGISLVILYLYSEALNNDTNSEEEK